MLVVMMREATEEQVATVVRRIEDLGYSAHVTSGPTGTSIHASGAGSGSDLMTMQSLPGVVHAVQLRRPFRLVLRETHPENTVVEINGVAVGGKDLVIVAGPCAVESKQQLFTTAERVKDAGVHLLRGGAYKPRTSPYSFQGLGEEGMRLLAEVKRQTGLATVSEVVDEESASLAEKYVDVLQIGARNMQNYVLLRRAARSGKPVLLKRGVAATLDEFLGAAEYILAEGNSNVILCERGIRTFSDYTRFTLDLSIVPFIKSLSHLPIITDPSHATGQREMVLPLARASVAAGADGVMVEVHPEPARALSDGGQSLYLSQLDELVGHLTRIAPVMGRSLPHRR